MKGIVLAGGLGTRLRPLTLAVSKQLLPVFDKPMIYYPLSTLMLAGVRDILVIATTEDLPRYRECLGDGASIGVRLSYLPQRRPDGIAAAVLLAADFLKGARFALILGDNLFFGEPLVPLLSAASKHADGATIFGCRVGDPERYGVVEIDAAGRPIALEEKPTHSRAGYAVPGLYFYDGTAVGKARSLKPSERHELEITDLNRAFLSEGRLTVRVLGDDVTWFDAGTDESLLDAANFVRSAEGPGEVMVGSIHATAFRLGYVDGPALVELALAFEGSAYGRRLLALANSGTR